MAYAKPTDKEIRKQADSANQLAQEKANYQSLTFDEVELDYAEAFDWVDPGNASWDQVPIQGQCQRLVAHDSMLPELGPESNTPMNVQEQSDAWIQRHLNEEERELLYGDSDPLYETHLTACTLIPNSDEQHPAGSPYHELEDGTAILD